MEIGRLVFVENSDASRGAVLSYKMRGALESDNAHHFLDTLVDRLTNTSTPISVVELDLSELNYIASRGVGALMEILKETNRRGQSLMLVNISPHVKSIFEVLGFVSFFNIVDR